MRTVPELGRRSPARVRSRVVLPAPSGPTRPVMLPCTTVVVIWSRAAGPSAWNRLTRPLTSMAGRPSQVSFRDPQGHRHALAQLRIRILHHDPQAVDQGGPQVRGLHGFGGELRGGGHEAHDAVVGLVRPGIGAEQQPGAGVKRPRWVSLT